ncbi:MAG: hypothetical protein ABI624_11795 [Casimicrobiaceae bacterium]
MMGRNFRRSGAAVAMLALLFAQLSLAAYACPFPDGGKPQVPAASMHSGCAGEEAALFEGGLCELHCQVMASVPSSPVSDLGVVSAAPLLVERPFAAPIAAPRTAQRIAHATMATAPPVTIRYCRLLV